MRVNSYHVIISLKTGAAVINTMTGKTIILDEQERKRYENFVIQEDIQPKDDEERETAEQDLIVVGFSQVGAESDWRKANTESMMETFTLVL